MTGQAAARFNVGVSTLIGWVGRLRHSGEYEASPQGRPRGLKVDPHRDFLLPLIEVEPDMTIAKTRRRLREELGVAASVGTIWKFLDRCRLTFNIIYGGVNVNKDLFFPSDLNGTITS